MVEAILEAAAQLLAADGLPALTSNAVAVRAGCSIGSFYQYFPDTTSLLAELVARAQARRMAALAALATAAAGAPLDELVALLVDAALANDAASPELARSLDEAEVLLPLSTPIEAAGATLDATLASILSVHLPHLDPHGRLAAARTARLIVRAIVDDAMAVPDPVRARQDAGRACLAWLRAA
jgi:AcrR family transcriptional regulator